jgi:hypothetical protein
VKKRRLSKEEMREKTHGELMNIRDRLAKKEEDAKYKRDHPYEGKPVGDTSAALRARGLIPEPEIGGAPEAYIECKDISMKEVVRKHKREKPDCERYVH